MFVTEVAALPGDAKFGEQNLAKDVFEVAAHVVDARIAAARGDGHAAIEHWKKAVEIQDTLHYDEPADWYYPVRESLGAALLKLGNAQDAEKTFRADLLQNPRNPRSLFGLKESLLAQGKMEDAGWVESQLAASRNGADTVFSVSAL